MAGLLYAGTEFGILVSFDDGARWQPLQLNLPRTPVTDIKVFRKDLVLSTMGRGFWILDDLTPLHEVSSASASAAVRLFKARPAYRLSGASRPWRDSERGVIVFIEEHEAGHRRSAHGKGNRGRTGSLEDMKGFFGLGTPERAPYVQRRAYLPDTSSRPRQRCPRHHL